MVKASTRFIKVLDYLREKYSREEGRNVKLYELYDMFFKGKGHVTMHRWRTEYDDKGIPNAVLKQLMILREKEGINVPDYFQDEKAPMLIGDEKKVLTIESLKKILEKNNETLINRILQIVEDQRNR